MKKEESYRTTARKNRNNRGRRKRRKRKRRNQGERRGNVSRGDEVLK